MRSEVPSYASARFTGAGWGHRLTGHRQEKGPRRARQAAQVRDAVLLLMAGPAVPSATSAPEANDVLITN